MAAKTLPDVQLVHECLTYNPNTGVFRWRARSAEQLSTGLPWNWKCWNGKYADNVAGCVLDNGYVRIHIGRVRPLAHRLAWLLVYGEPVPDTIDHIDGDKTNNRIGNLRAATKAQNGANSKMRRGNKSGVKSVYQVHNGRFRVMINRIHIGYFATLEEATEACRAAATRIYGEFAKHS